MMLNGLVALEVRWQIVVLDDAALAADGRTSAIAKTERMRMAISGAKGEREGIGPEAV